MKDHKLGIGIVGGAENLTVPEHITLLKEIGWDGFFTGWNHDRIGLWAETGAKNGMIYTSIHAPFSREHHIWNGDEIGEQLIKDLITCVGDCARYDIPVMVLHTGNGFSPAMPATPTQAGLDHYARVVEAADKCGVKLGFENNECEHSLVSVMQAFGDVPCVGFCFDTGHECCYRSSDMMAMFGSKLCHTHFDDNFGPLGDTLTWKDDSHLPMGDGIVDFGRVMDNIEKSGYTGVLSCELERKSRQDRDTHGKYEGMHVAAFYALALDRMRKILRKEI